MPLESDYQRVAKRSLQSAEASLGIGIQENCAFFSYHAFESTGCALSIVEGLPVGPRVHHNDKVRNFTLAANRRGNGLRVAGIAVSLASIRNNALYPIHDAATGTITSPERAITMAQASTLKKRVTGIVNWVDRHL